MIKHEFSFEFKKSGIMASVVEVKTYARKRFWNKWKLVDCYKAACTGFNMWTGAEWTGQGLKRIPVQTECDINRAAQKEILRSRVKP